ncbi:M48 family metallopeptidase [Colwellia piezophila]|uniref:M48 family metallopeptidase n=1 Tax=Colwellia piezophila TaxID=211668 RepID=UPI00036801E1|nr:SprT family zinc-dependent metalloprotease [Colwellia piezophila]
MFEYQLIRSKRRKTLSLQVKYGQVTVRAPYYVTSAFIDTFINEKSAWLRAKIAEQQCLSAPLNYRQDAGILLLGEPATLNISIAKQASVTVSDELSADNGVVRQLNIALSERVNTRLKDPTAKAEQIKKQLERYFKQQAQELIFERLEVICQQTSLTPTKIKIRQYRSRWGSCNNRGEVSFNYLLMMTPLFVIDYVIVHELCHLVHLNHSKCFWQLVAQHSPNYKIAKQWLSDHQVKLHWQKPS